jgi:hypothetical protein
MQDFFISYNRADLHWAQGIGDWLDHAGYTTILQAADFVAGSNFVSKMHAALQTGPRLIMVLSPDYLAAKFPEAEWTAAFAKDPTGLNSTLIPVRVRECSPDGLLKPIVYIDLVGLNAEQAKAKFLAEFRATMEGQRTLTPDQARTVSPKPQGARRPRGAVKQTAVGNNITQVAGDQLNYQKPPVIKTVVQPREGAISPAQRRQVQEWIERLVDETTSMSRDRAFGMWWNRLKSRFGVEKYEELLAADLPDVATWVRQQSASNVNTWKTKAPDAWRQAKYTAIKAAMREMGVDNETYYPQLAARLKMRKPFSSLTELTKVNLDRVYNMVLREAKGG